MTLVDLLRSQAERQPDALAFRFLPSGEADGTEVEWTYRDLDRRARAIAVRLRELRLAGERALLLYPPGLDFVAAFFGCAYAGVVAVPGFPHHTSPRLGTIARDCGARIVLTTRSQSRIIHRYTKRIPELDQAEWHVTDDEPDRTADTWSPPDITADSLAFLQYTSGSTAQPKGVMVSHGNIVHNSRSIAATFGTDRPGTHQVGWLPLYHDMGLIGNIMQPVHVGASCTLMSPLAFLQRPSRWLAAISRYGGTVSGGPNFAYDACVRRIRPDECEGLDLSGWAVAFNGAEPVRAETLERFAARFAEYGFRSEAFLPCYGLAEATLFVAGVDRATAPVTISVDSDSLARGVVVPGSRRLVPAGRIGEGHRVEIVDPVTGTDHGPDAVGEIWVAGPSVARGYWGRPAETANAFDARLDGTSFLRTGDLGFLRAGELFVTGRSKDVIIVRGRNIYPQDVELTVEQAHPAVRPSECAAFSIVDDGQERLAVAAEAELDGVDPVGVMDAIRRAVLEEHDVAVHTVALLRPRSLPKTSSGKVQRHACRAGLAEGTLTVLASSVAEGARDFGLGSESADAWLRTELEFADSATRRSIIEDFVQREIARAVGVSGVDSTMSPAGLGLDSLLAVEVQTRLEDAVGVALPVGFLVRQSTVADIVTHLVAASRSGREPVLPAPSHTKPLASSGQQRLWFLDRLMPGNAAYNVHFGIRIDGALDPDLLAIALAQVVQRHTALRTVLSEVDGELHQVVKPVASVQLNRIDPAELSGVDRADRLRYIAETLAMVPFDLTAGPLLRCHLATYSDHEHVLLLCLHHAITDGWSIGLLARELAAGYEAVVLDSPPLPEPRLQLADYAHWERTADQSVDREFWARRLAGTTRLDIPADRPRTQWPPRYGNRVDLDLPPDISERLVSIGRAEGGTAFVALLAGYVAFLHRYTGQDDVRVGTVVANRARPEARDVIGFLANTIVVRCEVSGALSFRELVRLVRDEVSDALAHSELPYSEIVRSANRGDDSPLFETSFVLENTPVNQLTAAGTTWRRLTWAPDGAVAGTAKFELSVALEEVAGGYAGVIEYDGDRFDRDTVERIATQFQTLLAGLVVEPDRAVSLIPFIPPTERRLLAKWNDTAANVPYSVGFPELFEQQVRRTPDQVAVLPEVTYRELNAMANRLARQLSVGRGDVVGLLMPRGLDLLVAVLAVFKAGAAYLPLDPNHPAHRHFQVLEATRLPLLIGSRDLVEQLQPLPCEVLYSEDIRGLDGSDVDLRLPVGPDDLAYVIFTSGSTGAPKGAMVEHLGMINHLHAKIYDLGLTEADTVVQNASQCFDISVWQFLAALLVGGRVDIVPEATANDPARLFQHVSTAGTTILEVVPSLLRAALEQIDGLDFSALRWLLVTGEAFPPELGRRWLTAQPDVALLNAYGPTECSDDVAHFPIFEPDMLERAITPIGYPVLNTQLYVLDRYRQPAPIGVPGELYVGGFGVGRGYLGRPDLTAERFVPDWLSGDSGARLYRTGDIARWSADGQLEFLGRVDNQVKIRGFRIELGEVEAVLRSHPTVRDVVVVARDERLVGYLVADTVDGVEDWLRSRLPSYLVPSALVVLDRLPLTPNGKVDRAALPAPVGGSSVDFVAPRGPTEDVVAGIWSEVLEIDRVGAHDDFFALGGHSLVATRVVSRIRQVFGVELPLRRLFEAATVAGVAQAVQQARSDETPKIRQIDRAGALQPSFAQQRLWFLEQLSPGAAYNVPGAVRIRGPLDVDALRATLHEIVRRHEVLRSSFVDGPMQVLHADMALGLDIVQDVELDELLSQEARRPFDLTRPPLIRAKLGRLADDDHVLVLVMHHIISDGWSLGVLMREASALYRAFTAGSPSPLPELPVQYADFAAWQREWLAGPVLDEQVDYWRDQLADVPTLDLPTDHRRPSVPSGLGGQCPVVLDTTLVEELRRLGRGTGATLFMTLLAGFQILLARYSGQQDVVVGSPIAGRRRAELENLIGFFVNTLVLRSTVSGSFRELLGRVRDTTLDAYTHQDVPFEKLVEILDPPRDLARTPLFQVMFILQNAPRNDFELGGTRLDPVALDTGTAKFDLTLTVEETAEGTVEGYLEYSTDLFTPDTAQRMVTSLHTLLTNLVRDPDQAVAELPLLTEEQRHQLVHEWNDTSVDVPDRAIHELFEEQALRTPDATALIHGDCAITYAELNAKANRIARYLVRHVPDRHVGVRMRRSIDLVAAQLGTMKAGKAYVSLDPSYPAERLRLMVTVAGLSVVLEPADLARAEITAEPSGNLGIAVSGDDAAYLIFTSGSTGTPNGVVGLHRGAVNRMSWMWRRYPFEEDEVCVLKTSPNFVDSVWETFGPLLRGVPSIILDDETVQSPTELLNVLGDVTRIVLVPSLIRVLLDEDLADRVPRLKYWTSSGEALPGDLVRRFQQRLPGRTLLNLYGSSEVSADSLAFDASTWAGVNVPIGRPIDNTRVFVLDSGMQLVPVGVPGELYVGGVGVGRGYVDRPGLTAQRFVADWLSGNGRLYRTGDVVRWTPDGQLEFLGRVDNQVKMRGFRIELGDIESVLREHPEVHDVVVAVRDDRLVAYLVTDGVDGVRDWLGSRVPSYLVPSTFVVLDRLPLTPNGKVDRAALPDPSTESGVDYVAPRGPAEAVIAGIWAEVLGVDWVGAHDDFFALGGHSLIATRIVSRIRQAFGVELPLRRLFETATVAGVARAVEHARAAEMPGIQPVDRSVPLTLSFAQQRLWFLAQLSPGAAYNIPGAVRIRGPLDVDALRASLQEVVRRHEVLRASFREGPTQHVSLDVSVTLEHTELDAALAEAQRPFDLTRAPLMRVRLVRLAEDEHVLVLVMHHIISDGWSLAVLMRETSTLYQGGTLPELPVQYADFAAWQRDWLTGPVLDAQISYWRGQLAGLPPALDLPTDFPRPAVRGGLGGRCAVELDEALVGGLRRVGRNTGATLFMTLVAGFQVLLARYSGQGDIAVGSPVAGRNRVELENLIGFFVNTLVLRSTVSGSFRELLGRVRDTTLDAYAHQDMPFEKLVEILDPPRDLARTPLFQVMMILHNAPPASLELGGAQVEPIPLDTGTTKFDLTLSLAETSDGTVEGYLEYDTDLFRPETAQRMVTDLQNLLAEFTEDPDRAVIELPLTIGHVDVPDRLVHQLFEEHAERTPDAPAVVSETGELSYAQVNAQANRIARWLRDQGVGAEVTVAIMVEPSLDMLPGLLGILKAGGGYLPLDPQLPANRVEHILRDSGAAILLTTKDLSADLDYPSENLPNTARPANIAYTIYTSGSTGTPKGVVVEHRQIVNYFAAITERFTLAPGMRYAMLQPLWVDSCLTVLAPAICGGGTLHVLPRVQAADPHIVRDHFRRHDIDVLKIAPSHIAALLDAYPSPDLLPRHVLALGGEGSRWDWIRDTVAPLANCHLNIHYGPTETTVGVLTNEIRLDDEHRGPLVPLGQPLGNTRVYVLDPTLKPTPIGVPGEVYIAGNGVTRGYLNKPGLTAMSYLPDPQGGRMYRTGDLGRRLADGRIEFLGRVDSQVKVRGFRVEPAEIDTALAGHPAVRAAVTAAKADRLVSYVVPRDGEPADLRAFLRDTLPDHLVPSAVVLLDELPLTAQGKVDLQALPEPPSRPSTEPPASPLEAQLVAVWEEVLGTAPIGVNDDFFDLGGHSLLAVRITTLIRSRLDHEVSLETLFRNPTVARLARSLTEEQPPAQVLTTIRPGTGTPLLCVPPVGSDLACYAELSRTLDLPMLGLRAPEDSLERMAAVCVDELLSTQPQGPYLLAGWSTGGLLAFEIARQLRERGHSVDLLALLDTHAEPPQRSVLVRFAAEMAHRMGIDVTSQHEQLSPHEQRAALAVAMREHGLLPPDDWDAELTRMIDLFTKHVTAVDQYRIQRTDQRITLIAATADLARQWEPLVGEVESYVVPGDHYSMLRRPHVTAVAERLRRSLIRAGGVADQ